MLYAVYNYYFLLEITAYQLTWTIVLKWHNSSIFFNFNLLKTVIDFDGSFDSIYTNGSPIFPIIFGAAFDTENAKFMSLTIPTYRCLSR